MNSLKQILNTGLLSAFILMASCAYASDSDIEIYANGNILG